jgi:hypothetical protein
MDEDDAIFPMDVYIANPSTLPWNFRPQGYLVAILADAEEAERGQLALEEAGVSSTDIKRYTGEDIVANHARYEEQRSRVSRIAGIADDEEGRDLYLGYAREGRSAMWVRIPDGNKVARAMRALADVETLYLRYYGEDTRYDFHVS